MQFHLDCVVDLLSRGIHWHSDVAHHVMHWLLLLVVVVMPLLLRRWSYIHRDVLVLCQPCRLLLLLLVLARIAAMAAAAAAVCAGAVTSQDAHWSVISDMRRQPLQETSARKDMMWTREAMIALFILMQSRLYFSTSSILPPDTASFGFML